MRQIIIITILIITLSFSACVKPPEYPIEPFIEFVSIDKTSFSEVSGDVTMLITIYFEDGDGDIGGGLDDSLNMYWEDSRIPGYFIPFKIPFVELQGNHDDISGNIYVTWDNDCIDFTSTSESFYYNIYIVDRAGHESNIIQTPGLSIICN
ncbi:MAG: hypothetical protein ACKVPJ_07000 [Chitinophagales bacterium]